MTIDSVTSFHPVRTAVDSSLCTGCAFCCHCTLYICNFIRHISSHSFTAFSTHLHRRRRTFNRYLYKRLQSPLAVYRSVEKTVSTQVKYLHPSRHTEVIIGRLRLGKCYLNAYLQQIGKHRDGLCNHCNKPETVSFSNRM